MIFLMMVVSNASSSVICIVSNVIKEFVTNVNTDGNCMISNVEVHVEMDYSYLILNNVMMLTHQMEMGVLVNVK